MKAKRILQNGANVQESKILDLIVSHDSTVSVPTEDFFEQTKEKSVTEMQQVFESAVQANKSFTKKIPKKGS